MQLLKGVQYDAKPAEIVFWQTAVDVNTNIKQIEVEDKETGEKAVKWQADTTRYDKDEYIEVLHNDNVSLTQQVTQSQLAIVEVYEMMLG